MNSINSLFIASLSFLIFSCGNNKKAEPEVVTVDYNNTEEITAQTTEANFKDDKIAAVFDEYTVLNTALVNTNAEDAAKAANELANKITATEGSQNAINAARAIAGFTNIEDQRKEFVEVTAEVEKMLQGAIASGVIYKQFCPMAFNNKGAFWLSNTKEIYNPYFGDKMLKCGRLEAEIK